MSDGLQNGWGDVRTEATLRWTQDHATSLPGTQKVQVDTIGFAIAASEADAANDVLQTAASNGGGQFYSTVSEAQLSAALEDSIRRIMAATFAFATPVIPSTSATGLARVYLAAFQSDPSRPFWRGFLKAYNLDANGRVPMDTNGVLDASYLAWEAGQKLTEMARRGSDDLYTDWRHPPIVQHLKFEPDAGTARRDHQYGPGQGHQLLPGRGRPRRER